ncbi:hypothetical protein [Idiomarina aminovorans]|uniref:hypothetical protein n=1 Tax=Idiomarina aminovorans TaxID=2914829 RepID=UPI0020064F18|nr:hypothetical protein [Idiomarina sp. ATCH4]MCK7459120.1 hypothetical protein [Idiomarina sp. ATCH4]
MAKQIITLYHAAQKLIAKDQHALGMIQSENKDLFLKLAAMISFADIAEQEEEKAEDDSGSVFSGFIGANLERKRNAIDEPLSFINRKKEERAALKLYAKEMGMDIRKSDIKAIDKSVLEAIFIASETLSEKLFANEELRKEFFQDGLVELLRKETVEDKAIPLTERKVMLFEAIAMAYADGECSALERAVLEKLAEQFDIDVEFIDEAGEVIRSFNRVTQEGLELINE